MKRTHTFLAATVAGILFVAARALALPFTMNGSTYQVQDIAGSGPNKALLELDFGTNTAPQPYLFGYEWSNATSPNGRDLLVALAARNDGLSFTDTYYASFDEHLLNTLSYNTLQPPDDYPNDFWLYFTSTDGQSWSEAEVGYDAVPVTNGGFFAWGLQTSDPNEDIYSPPYLPPSHSPAAISTGLLGDANGDGKVDLSDLNIVLNHLGAADLLLADGNFDGQPTIDLADLNDVLNNLGTSSPNTVDALTTAPEPATLGLAGIALLTVSLRRRR